VQLAVTVVCNQLLDRVTQVQSVVTDGHESDVCFIVRSALTALTWSCCEST